MSKCCEICQQVLHMCQKSTQHGKLPTETSRYSIGPKGSFNYRHQASFTSHIQGKQMGSNRNLFTNMICVCCSNEGKSALNVIQTYLSGILSHKGGSVAILSDNETEFKNKAVNETCDQLGTNRLFSNPFYSQGNSRMENVHNFLKQTPTRFLDSSDREWDDILPFACYWYNIFPVNNGTESSFF